MVSDIQSPYSTERGWTMELWAMDTWAKLSKFGAQEFAVAKSNNFINDDNDDRDDWNTMKLEF